jgi:hypothetical protein
MQLPKTSLFYYLNSLSLFSVCLFFSASVSAQVISKNELIKLTASADTFKNAYPIEKLYLQFDKPYYAIGDTIWFKAYLFNSAYLMPSSKSGLLYIELDDDNNKTIKRIMVPVAYGLSWGNIALDAKEMSAGNYIIRAYTNWMRNFGEDYIFRKSFYFGNLSENNWLANTKVNLSKGKTVDTARLRLLFNYLNKEPVILKQVALSVLDGKKIIYKSKGQTNMEGALNVNLPIKATTKHLTLLAEELNNNEGNQKLVIPIPLNRPENMDLQFMPEGGNLVASLQAHIAFKAVGEDGKATEVQGSIYDSKQQLVATFKSVHKGMGTFDMIPQSGENYTAKITFPGGLIKTFSLPPVKSAGTALKVREINQADSLAISITSTEESGSYYLVGQSRGVICYGALVNLNKNVSRIKIPETFFPTGITRFTLLNGAMQPLNDRIVFINHYDNLYIDLSSIKTPYTNNDSLSLQVHVKDKDGDPVRGNFSFSITDDSQVKIDSIKSGSIISNLLLTSDLKGEIEDPGYYFQSDPDGKINKQLDNLMLTQGWVGYDWKDIISPLKPQVYNAEQEFDIKGRVTRFSKKPIVNTRVTMLSKKPSFVLDTVSDKNGRFIFSNIMLADTPAYILQTRNKNGKSLNVDIEVDEFKPPVFTGNAEGIVPWYVNNDSTLMNYVKNNIKTKELERSKGGGRVLKEVIISAKKIIKGSQNPNGPGNADIVIDEKDLEKAGKKTFLQLLQERVPGFKQGYFDMDERPFYTPEKVIEDRILYAFITDGEQILRSQNWYFINGKAIKFIIDGIPLYKIFPIYLPAFNNITNYLQSHSAEDIKGIEVNSSAKYGSRYVPMQYAETIHTFDVAFVEITTRSGHGPAISNTPGLYLYRPIPFSFPRKFYSPKYTVKDRTTAAIDYRSTILWEPNLVTNKDGNATISFYAADKKGIYTITIEGTDCNGNIGSRRSKINVNHK